MSFSEEFFANKQYFLNTIAHLVSDEKDRIVQQGLASKEEISAFIDAIIKDLQTKNSDGKEVTAEDINNIYRALKSIILPGDFQKFSAEKSADDAKTATNKEELVNGQDEDDTLHSQVELAEKILGKLDSIAYQVGRKGDHETAYLIEQTARTIRVSAERGILLGKSDVSDDIQEKNQALIREAHSLMDEFQSKFESAGYQSYVSAIRAEMRNLRENDPVEAANSLRSKWKQENC